MENEITIRQSQPQDLAGLLKVEREAFGDEEGPEIVELVNNLLDDPTAKPLLSLVAVAKERIVGHILFSRANLDSDEGLSVSNLAPLAVDPEYQNMGVGGRLIHDGLRILSGWGVKLVFVLGHPGYYPRYGFKAVGDLGFETPYPIPEKYADAWMIQELSPGYLGKVKGRVICADALDRPEYWA